MAPPLTDLDQWMLATLMARELSPTPHPLTAGAGDSWRWQLRDKDGQWVEMGSRVKWLAQGLAHTGYISGSSTPYRAYVVDDKDGRERELSTSQLTALDPLPKPPGADDYVETDYDKYGDPVLRKMGAQIREAKARDTRAQALAEAERLKERAQSFEPETTATLQEVVTAAGGHMEGLDFRLKTPDSTVKKILRTLTAYNQRASERGLPPTTIAAEAAKVGDSLRYTAVVPPDRNIAAARDILAQLQAQGHTVVKIKNSWPKGDDYSGINVKMLGPNGLPWELQFHTADSYQTKEYGTHADYKITQDPDVPVTEKVMAYRRMVRMWADVEQPEGWESFGEIIWPGRPEFLS